MSRQITIYYSENSEGENLKERIQKLANDRNQPYYGRSISTIAYMLLSDKLDDISEERENL